jgi:hypothetical protein
MRRTIEWIIVVVAVLLIIGLASYAHGRRNYHGDEIGSDGGEVTTVQIVP